LDEIDKIDEELSGDEEEEEEESDEASGCALFRTFSVYLMIVRRSQEDEEDEEEMDVDLSEAMSDSASSASDREELGDDEPPKKKVRFSTGVEDAVVQPPAEPVQKDATSANAEASSSSSRYVPPHLRNAPAAAAAAPTTVSPKDDPRLRRLVMGHLNRLSSSNVAVILSEIESIYRSHPRAVVSSVLTALLLGIISGRDNLGDSFVVTYAGFVALLARAIGKEFAAGIVARAVEDYDAAAAKAEEVDEATRMELEQQGARAGGKERTNLVAFLAELYNFRVIACPLIYDLVRGFIENGLDELEVELLLKVVKSEFRLSKDFKDGHG
jgi:nucleolar MIF4G domain-containing protein 1